MSYCQSRSESGCSQLTSFQKIVQNATSEQSLVLLNETLMFGLDFRTEAISAVNKYISPTSVVDSGSSMQLGGIDAAYEGSIVWMRQTTTQPTYHEFMVENLDFCGASVLGNYSTTWQAMVDTGAVCLTLPGEIYDSFSAWFDNTTVIEDVSRMPAFSFQIRNGNGTAATAYIPLGDLLLNVSAIASENGAPYVSLRDPQNSGVVLARRLCVLRGQEIGNKAYRSPPPQIVLGSLALQSLYFAADFAQYTVGIANKLSAAYIESFNATNRIGCAAPVQCFGKQYFVYAENRCHDPDCRRYFFTELDKATMTCKYNRSNLIGGLIFIVLIILAEVVAYFVTQYSAYTALESSRLAPIDPLTKYMGLGLTCVVDWAIIHILKWVPARSAAVAATGDGIVMRQQVVNAD